MSLIEGMSQTEAENLDKRFKKLQELNIFGSYNLETGVVKVVNSHDLIQRLEYHTFRAFKKAFPDTKIRKNAVDLYLAGLMNNYKKQGLDQTASLVAMMVSLEQEADEEFKTLTPFLAETYQHWNFEKVKLQ